MTRAAHDGTTSQAPQGRDDTAANAIPAPPVNRSRASDAAPNAAVPPIASNAPLRAASTALIKVAEISSRDAEPDRRIEAAANGFSPAV